MSISKMSADLNDIPSLTHLNSVTKPHDSFAIKGQDNSEIKKKLNMSPSPENFDENESPLIQEKNLLLEKHGLSIKKKQIFRVDLDNFQDIPPSLKENFEITGNQLHKLEKKALKYQEIEGDDFILKKEHQIKGYTQNHEEIETLVNHPEFEKVDLVSQFISEIERPSLNKIEEILKKTKNRFQTIEQEYLNYQREQEKRPIRQKQRNIVEHEEKAMKLLNNGEENQEFIEEDPRGSNENDEEEYEYIENENSNETDGSKHQTLMDLDINSKLKKLMSSLKKNSMKSQLGKAKEPKRAINAEKIRFEKSFKYYLKKKKTSFLQRTSPSPEKQQKQVSPLQSPRKPEKKRIVEHISKSELDLIQFFFEDIPKSDNNTVLKSDLSKYMLSNTNILELYNINPKNLVSELNSFDSSNPNCLSLKELIQFLKLPRDFVLSIADYSKEKLKSMKQSLITDLPNVCLLNDDEINAMRNVFKELDKTGDLAVSRRLLIRNLRKDLKISQILHRPAIYLPKFDKVLILDRVFHQIEREEHYGEEINRKAKENISWQHFIAHFLNYRRIFFISRELFHKLKRKTDLKMVFDDQDLLDLSPEQLTILKQAFDSMEKTPENYVYVPNFLKTLQKSPKYEYFCHENARRASEKFCLPNETVLQVLKRIEKEADDHLDWDELLEFFTRRGRPKYFIIDKEERAKVYKEVLDVVLPQKIHTKKFQTLKKKFFLEEPEDDVSEEKDETQELQEIPEKKTNHGVNSVIIRGKIKIAGYDSDPEYHLKSAKTNKINESAFNKAKKVGFFGAIFKDNIDRENFKVTVPHPFAFHEREINKAKPISQIKLEKSLQDKENEELELLKIRFKAQPVPKHVKDCNLWKKISKKQEDRRIDVKKHSKAMTIQNEKPFSFYFRDKDKKKNSRKKTKEERENFVFKASEIPWFSSLKMMIDPETKERERREKIERNAHISLSLSRLPPRMELYEKERQEKEVLKIMESSKLNEEIFTFQPKITGKVPDFQRLQKNFETILETRKQNNFTPTVPVAPKCSENTRGIKRDYLDEENELKAKEVSSQKKRDPIEIAMRLKKRKPKYQASSTLKFQALLEKRKQEQEIQEFKMNELRKAEEERQLKTQKMKQKVQSSSALVDNAKESKERQKELLRSFKDKISNDTASYLMWKKDLEERMDQKPLLLESTANNKFISSGQLEQRQQDFDRIAELLEENNLDAFNEEEREIIKEMAALKNQGYNLENLENH